MRPKFFAAYFNSIDFCNANMSRSTIFATADAGVKRCNVTNFCRFIASAHFKNESAHHKMEIISGILEKESSLLIKNWFKKLRNEK